MARKNVIQFSVEVIDKVSKKLDLMAAKIGKFAKRAAVAGAGIAAGFALAAKSAIGAADAIGKTSKVVGISAEALQELRFAAGQAGISNIGLDDSLRRMQRRMGEFINSGAGPAQKALEGLNISITDTAGNFIGTEAAFDKVVDAMGQLNTTAEKSAVAAQLFGDDFGPKLVTLMNEGGKGIAALRKEARDLGLVISNESIAASEDAQDSFTRLTTLIRTKMIKVFADNAEAIEAMADTLLAVAVKALQAADALAVLFGVGEVNKLRKEIKELGEDIDARERGKRGRRSTKDISTEELRVLKEINEERLRGIKIYNEVVKTSIRNESGGGGGGGGFGFGNKDDSLQSFIDGFQSVEEKIAILKGKMLLAIAEGYKVTPETMSAFNKQIREMWESGLDAIKVTSERKVPDIANTFDPLIAMAEKAAQSMQTAMADYFFDPFDKGLKGMLQGFINVVRRMLAEALALKIMTNIFGGGTGFFASLLGRSSGGPVNAGQPYMVGERGPELFVPHASGSIRPSTASSGGGMQFVTNIDASGADPSLISRLPQYMEQRDRMLMVKVKEYVTTGSTTL
jgi:hypothetical protein